MGGTVSREHARLPFGYTHARKEDHSCSASASTLASRRQRIASRLLLLKSQDSTTSVTPLQSPHHRLPLPEDGPHPGGGGSAATGANGVIANGEGGLVGPTGFVAAHLSFPSLSSQDDDDDDDGDNAEIVSLSSILNQGPEFKLQWHAVSQDLDLDPNVDTYPYPYTYPIPYPGASAVVATGSEGTKSSIPMAEAQVQVQVQAAGDINRHHMMMMMESSPSSPSSSSNIRSPASASACACAPTANACACSDDDYETAAGGACSNPGLGSPASLMLTSATSAAAAAAATHRKDVQDKDAPLTYPLGAIPLSPLSPLSPFSPFSPLVIASQPHASLQSQSRSTVTISTAAATATNSHAHNHNHNHIHHPHTLSLSALPSSRNTLSDKTNNNNDNGNDNDNDDGLNTVYDNSTNNNTTASHQQQEENNTEAVHTSSQRTTQSMDPLRQSSSQQDLIGSASTVFEDDFDDSDDELKGHSDRKMDLIAALGIADMPDRTPSPGPQNIPFNFFTEEPTFHALQDPTSCQFFNNMRRYTTDGGGYSKGKEVRRPWMDMTDEAVIHLPQDFFDRYGSLQQDLDGDGLGDDFDGELEQEELPRSSRRLGKRLSLGNTGYSSSGANFGGHNVSANSAMMMNMMMLSAPDEDVAHLSPIPFSELPSLTNIGLCSHGIVKLSSNIRLLSSTTCLQVCCNDLCAIPPEIGFLRNLTLLDLSKNSLMTIPDSIRFLTKLVDLRLSSNFIDTLPPSIGELTKLTHLSLENNQLKRVPRQLGQLKALTHLVLDDNPITVLPAEVGQLQYLRRLKLERCPLVREFFHAPVHSPPTLMELAARVILRQGMMVPPLMPSHLKAYLRTSQRCSFCDGPYFESSVKRGKMIDKNEVLVPLEYTLCMPHWNTEMERVKLLFGPRPVTSPKPRTPRRTAVATGLLITTPEAGAAAGTAAAVTTTATTATRRHTKSESAGPVLASTAASVLGGGSSSPVSASPVGQAPLTFSLAPLSATSATVPPISETSSPSSTSGSGNGSSTRKSRGFRSKLGSSNGSGIWGTAIGSGSSSSGGNSSGWFSSSNNNSETNLTSAAAIVEHEYEHEYKHGDHHAAPLSSRTKKCRFSNPFASSRANSSGNIVGGGERRSPYSP
ncbi:hypothetical protein BG015_000610 [Linnemannia schmuckeri]|uniref:L domain-like protein n=1 Tax=Linnemannia schmuckeri TaxID=64567 RepID=A0A9P5VFQ2_9FUNG|nr:hypothetical protein BG015_000610 [Linnemannia schmuckeri]